MHVSVQVYCLTETFAGSMWIKLPSGIVMSALCHRFWWMRYLLNGHIFYPLNPWGTIRTLFHYYSECITVALVFWSWWSENCNPLCCISSASKSKETHSTHRIFEFSRKSILRKQFKFQIQSVSIVPAPICTWPPSSSYDFIRTKNAWCWAFTREFYPEICFALLILWCNLCSQRTSQAIFGHPILKFPANSFEIQSVWQLQFR